MVEDRSKPSLRNLSVFEVGASLDSSYRSEHIPTLDGWRAISVLAVMWYHAIPCGLSPGTIAFRLAIRAHLGVDIFFAISGFLICGKLLQELQKTGSISLKLFYLRRCCRIFPAVWVYLFVLCMLASIGWTTSEGWEFSSTLFFVCNYFPSYHGTVLGRYTAQFWSLAVEEHFYSLWPGIVLATGRDQRRLGWIALTLALAVFAWRAVDATHGWLILVRVGGWS